jgi:hypothetical protein
LAEALGLDIGTGAAGEINQALENYATSIGYDNMSDFYNNLGEMQNYTSAIQNLMEEQFVNNESYKDLFAEGTTGAEMFGSMD